MHNRRRSRCRASQGTAEKPAGARAGCARVGCQHMDVLSADPVVPEKRRAVRFARCESYHRVLCLAFLVTFWAMPKRNRLAAGETKLCSSREESESTGSRVPPSAARPGVRGGRPRTRHLSRNNACPRPPQNFHLREPDRTNMQKRAPVAQTLQNTTSSSLDEIALCDHAASVAH